MPTINYFEQHHKDSDSIKDFEKGEWSLNIIWKHYGTNKCKSNIICTPLFNQNNKDEPTLIRIIRISTLLRNNLFLPLIKYDGIIGNSALLIDFNDTYKYDDGTKINRMVYVRWPLYRFFLKWKNMYRQGKVKLIKRKFVNNLISDIFLYDISNIIYSYYLN